MAVAPGTRLGTYEILALLGAGGMGEVYRAHDHNLRRDVAVKVLPGALSADADRIARFEREARAVAALSHSNILAIHDFGSDGGVRYVVTELLEGRTLRDVLRGGPLAPPKAIAVATQIARGLEAAHARGIVHRDLKPENVFVLEDLHVKILDFGLAKSQPSDATATSSGVTSAGAVLGTAGYMAPEQVRGEAVDHRADIFSLGCVLYELLAGRHLFGGDSSIDRLHATLHVDPDLTAITHVPPSLTRTLRRCVEKKPAHRFQSAADLRFALETVTDERSAGAASNARPQRSAWSRAASVWMAIAALAGFGVAAAVWYARTPRQSTTAPTAAVQAARGIAVLPFENLGEADDAYFAAGVTEEVTLQIAKISALRVMSRNAVARFKDPSAQLPDMTRELNIGAVLAGSVRHAGSQVRVSVQLLAAPSGEMMWSEQYERTISNIFDVQSDIAFRVARALQASLAPEERARIERLPTSNTAAYELYLKQQPLSVSVPERNAEGLGLLDEAIALDPRFAMAHAARARRLRFSGNRTGRDDTLAAVAAAQTALTIDPQLARGHYELGIATSLVGRIGEARLSMQRAIELDSNHYLAMQDLAIMEVNAGRLDQAVYWTRRALPLAPNVAGSYYALALPLTFLDDRIAERFLTAAMRRFPGGLQSLIAVIELRRGHAAAGFERMRAVEAKNPGNAGTTALANELAVYAGASDAVQRLEAAVKTFPAMRGWWAPYTSRTLRAHLFMRAGQPERARPLIDAALANIRKAVEDGDRSHVPPYEEAALQLMLGHREVALELFDKAIDAGALEGEFPKVDPLMAGIRHEPRFLASLARIERMLAEMRQRVDFSGLEELVALPHN
jgi:serine/threonine-protein kinase